MVNLNMINNPPARPSPALALAAPLLPPPTLSLAGVPRAVLAHSPLKNALAERLRDSRADPVVRCACAFP